MIANNRAWRSAQTVRRQWLTQLLARKNPPKGTLRFPLGEIAAGHWTLCQALGTGSQTPPSSSAWTAGMQSQPR
jgi:ParB family transcriptional regulator, chromosome partitioning protein